MITTMKKVFSVLLIALSLSCNAFAECSAGISSFIAGEFKGWEGETLFKLDNGQIWQQSSYAYTYHYAYHPSVVIVQLQGCCRLIVDGVSENICVRRLK